MKDMRLSIWLCLLGKKGLCGGLLFCFLVRRAREHVLVPGSSQPPRPPQQHTGLHFWQVLVLVLVFSFSFLLLIFPCKLHWAFQLLVSQLENLQQAAKGQKRCFGHETSSRFSETGALKSFLIWWMSV